MNVPTLLVLSIVLFLVVLDICYLRRVHRRAKEGNCHSHCGGCSLRGACGNASSDRSAEQKRQ